MTNHVDPSAMPKWLLDEAKKDSPSAMAWLVSGYLAGVEVGRTVNPCPAFLTIRTDAGLEKSAMCGYAAGHVGVHDTIASLSWRDDADLRAEPPAPTSDGALHGATENRADVASRGADALAVPPDGSSAGDRPPPG